MPEKTRGEREALRDTDPAPSHRRKRTQQERSEETRSLLIHATIDCLATIGYARTTTQEVANRAGLTRGAQLHHFGNKAALVSAAIEQLFDRADEELRSGFEGVPADDQAVSAAVDVLWRIVSGPTGSAYMELAWAARTDAQLRAAMLEAGGRMHQRVLAALRRVSPGLLDDEDADLAASILLAMIEGLIFETVLSKSEARMERVLLLLKRLAPLIARPE
jgi:AcrR family transcriptional regulator